MTDEADRREQERANGAAALQRAATRRTLLTGGAVALGAGLASGWAVGRVRALGPIVPILPPEFSALLCRTSARIEVQDPEGPPRKVRFAYNGTGICTAAVPVALHRGHFARHNLDVEFVQFAGSTDQMLQALATEKADAGVSMALNWLKPLEGGFDVKLTTGLHGGCTRLLVRRDSGITDIAQLKGKAIGVSNLAGTPRHFFAVMLADRGLNQETDVEWREFPADLLPVALQRGEIAALAD